MDRYGRTAHGRYDASPRSAESDSEGVLQALQRLAQDQVPVLTGQTPSLCEWEGPGRGMMELTKPIIVGHSFGGSLAVSRSVDSAFVLMTSRVRWWLPRICASTAMLSRLIRLCNVRGLALSCFLEFILVNRVGPLGQRSRYLFLLSTLKNL